MLSDIVVDTNVFNHAQMPDERRFEDAGAFLEALLDGDADLCVDGVFNLNRPELSLIGHEYYAHIPPVGRGYTILVQLLQSGRVKMNVSKSVPPHLRRLTVSLIGDPRDRTFVFVAYNSDEHVLVSHDWVDYTNRVRAKIRKEMGVEIEEASVALPRVAGDVGTEQPDSGRAASS